jgi:uracil-DNA glycosylase
MSTSAKKEVVFSNSDSASKLAAEKSSLMSLRRAATGCRACDLWKHATQTVFGEGSPKATIMFVGEQPGDREDLAGRPFVGPAETCWMRLWRKQE